MLAAPREARAFERQWHLGGGLGFVAPNSGYSMAPTLALHAAYGISDVFDTRFVVAAAWPHPSDAKQPTSVLSMSTLGLAYKLDIIEWVPYIGVRAGAFGFGASPSQPYARFGGVLGTMAGIDYSFSRSFAVGAEFAEDLLLPAGTVLSGVLHAEYHWGF
jgi:hypothetical protein